MSDGEKNENGKEPPRFRRVETDRDRNRDITPVSSRTIEGIGESVVLNYNRDGKQIEKF
jgi:hypothetical protein